MTAVNMPLDIANDLLCTSRDYARFDPELAAEMARKALQIGGGFDLVGELDRRPEPETTDQSRDLEAPPGARSRIAGGRCADNGGDVRVLIILLRLRRSIRSGPHGNRDRIQAWHNTARPGHHH